MTLTARPENKTTNMPSRGTRGTDVDDATSTASSHDTTIPPQDDEIRPDNGYSYGSFSSYDRGTESRQTVQAKPAKSNTRALAPDLLRGFLMLSMALDHTALAVNIWEHGTGRVTEGDSVPIREWNRPAAYVVRTLTHLCGTGFTFLLGMGVVYLGRSRSRLGWSSWRLAKYFAERTVVLTLVTIVLGLILTGGKTWFMNIVLFSLAADYFLAGMLWLAISKTEPLLAQSLSRTFPDKLGEDEAEEPLISTRRSVDNQVASLRASTVSWHVHNALLIVLSLITIWWNIWLSPTHGYCQVQKNIPDTADWTTSMPQPEDTPGKYPLLALWFWSVVSKRIVSVFPPMAWVSFAILGLLYGRVIIARPWSTRALGLGHSFAGLVFLILFILTRVLRTGNLSEGCLETPEQERYPDRNPYLASPQSFFYIIKYPPDVAFWAFTMAGIFFLLAIFGAIPVRISKRFSLLLDFGTAALFFYVAHLFVVFALGAFFVHFFGHDVGLPQPMDPDSTRGIDNLFGYLGVWALAMLVLWPLTRLYSRFKSRKPVDSIWRFF
ncbi:hypothetical protein G7046_g2325 [Stylonectria norvegica]|nr:hypothetical protein G7046_g2325 [Stylonectria norvegica]